MTFGAKIHAGSELRPLYKLVSSKGTLLGTTTMPPHWADCLVRTRSVSFSALHLDAPNYFRMDDEAMPYPTRFQVATIYQTRSMDFPDGVELYGISLEDFERLPGCAFSPSAGYLRSLVEER